MTTQEAVLKHREEILRIAARHGATNVRVFGSVARGTAGPDSDLDILVDVDADRSPWFQGGLLMDLEELLRCRVDVVTEAGLHHITRSQVLAEARSL
jgi:uncharacterized protein